MSKTTRIFLNLFLIVAVLVAIFEFSSGRQAKEEYFLIKRGQNFLQVSNNLKAGGYIPSKLSFCFQVIRENKQGKILAGEYQLNNLSQSEIIQEITSGQNNSVVITIIPGYTLKNIGNILERKGIISSQEFLDFASSSPFDYPFLKDKPQDSSLEGYLFPDTYSISKKGNINEIVKQFLDNFGKKFNYSNTKRTVFEIVTMASLLEKEVKTPEDKKIVSGILWKRADNNLPLEVDATLLYFKTSSRPNLDDKSIDSLYNTYKYAGLPKGPICNPSIESLEAALNPADTPYWFYLTAESGETIYSRNLGEHLKNKAKHIK